jgi:hypothetical protein
VDPDKREQLNHVRKHTSAAKHEVFHAQDAADRLGDEQIRKLLLEAREALEAVDRRVATIRIGRLSGADS